ncbi:hypothetical protein C8T65DRAFT_671442 [Cerioporus squamosus]|nr:hypothetical protein C8T65DRAFT_671442 [Cerioporus squamosus]
MGRRSTLNLPQNVEASTNGRAAAFGASSIAGNETMVDMCVRLHHRQKADIRRHSRNDCPPATNASPSPYTHYTCRKTRPHGAAAMFTCSGCARCLRVARCASEPIPAIPSEPRDAHSQNILSRATLAPPHDTVPLPRGSERVSKILSIAILVWPVNMSPPSRPRSVKDGRITALHGARTSSQDDVPVRTSRFRPERTSPRGRARGRVASGSQSRLRIPAAYGRLADVSEPRVVAHDTPTTLRRCWKRTGSRCASGGREGAVPNLFRKSGALTPHPFSATRRHGLRGASCAA